MDYDTDSKAVLSRARRYLEYADSQGKNGSVRVGLWLVSCHVSGIWCPHSSQDASGIVADRRAGTRRTTPSTLAT